MDNIKFEITHDVIIAIIAKHIDVPANQILLEPVDIEGLVFATVRTDIQTAVKIDRKLKRLGGTDVEADTEEPQIRHG